MKKFYQSVSLLPAPFVQIDVPSLWIRDYMPIKTSYDNLVGFYYQCKYLNEMGEPSFDVESIWTTYCDNVYHARIVADGAHFMEIDRHWLVSETVAKENAIFPRSSLSEYLERLLGKEIIWIHPMPDDPFGHLDGIIVSLGKNKVGTYSNLFYENYLDKIKGTLIRYGYEVIQFPVVFDDYGCLSARGLFLNFATDARNIYLPIEEKESEAVNGLRFYLRKGVTWVNGVTPFLYLGGGLHCLTWEN